MCLLNIHKIIACLYIFLYKTLKIFCVMIPLLVDTSPDFALFRVVRPYVIIFTLYNDILMLVEGTLMLGYV